MKSFKSILTLIFVAPLLVMSGAQAAGEHPMGFFVTSKGIGNGADLGGLEGADAHCARLAKAAGDFSKRLPEYQERLTAVYSHTLA